MATTHQTQTQVNLSGVHLCCGGCSDALIQGATQVPGVSAETDESEGTAVITGPSPEALQQALEGIAANGLYGESDHPDLAIKFDSNLTQDRVQKATVSDIHNCCGPCYRAIRKAVHRTPGVVADTGEPGVTRFEVTGDFAPVDLLKSLHKYGFNARVTA